MAVYTTHTIFINDKEVVIEKTNCIDVNAIHFRDSNGHNIVLTIHFEDKASIDSLIKKLTELKKQGGFRDEQK